ncbi:MAG: hypothetical protein AMJ84_05755 [Acidithiobacillales bacterium SM23_46]|nr:MAG: hypothetical protein AMJ84_05755 [Acidithiobacillales bacterium SM23_46]
MILLRSVHFWSSVEAQEDSPMISRKAPYGVLQAVGIISLVAMLVVASGCGKQRTKMALNKVDKLLAKAEAFNVQKHAKAEMDQARQQRGQADQSMNAGDYANSVPTAGAAVRSAKDALAKAKQFEATEQKSDADREVKIMDTNIGSSQDPQLYKEIIELQNKMQAKYDKQRWVAVIDLAKEINQKVEQILQRLRAQANADLVEVRAWYKRLLDEGGKEYAQIQVGNVSDLIKQIEANIAHPTKNYLNAIALARQAMIDANDGIIEAKRRRSEEHIEAIQRKLIRAKQLEAEIFAPELWNASSADFATLIDNFWRKEYDFVLGAAGRLDDQVDTLIYETRKAGADYQRNQLAKRVAEMRNKGVDTYLPGRLAPLDKALEEAGARFQKPDEAFEDVKEICRNAQIEADEIMKAFGALADEWIRKGHALSNRARSVFGEMERIFREVHPTYVKPIDQALEDNKQTIKEDLRQRLEDMQARMVFAVDKHTAEEYREAIETSREVQDEATSVLATIYNVVAHNVITEILDEVTRYDREGAPEYAASDMEATKKLLQEAIDLRDGGEFQASITKATQARAQLEMTIETIEVTAAQAIESARAELKRSNETRTAQLRPDDYQRAQQLINEATQQLITTRLKDAILTAERAATLARQASRDAARIWALEELKQGESLLADSRQSGADIHSVQMVREADEDLTQAGQVLAAADALLGQKKFEEARAKYIEAKDLAVQAGEGAVRAKFRLVDEGEAAIVEARSYQGWRHQLPQLTETILALDRSKEAMAAGDYELSHQLARRAAAEAEKITAASKNTAFHKRLEVVDSLVAEATRTGGRYYQPGPLASLARELDRLREQYRSRTFDSNAEQVAEIEAHLQGMVETMPNVVAQWIGHQRERLTAIEQSDIPPTFEPQISEAKKFLRFAEMDFKRGKYRRSYTNLIAARRVVDEMASNQAEVEYHRSVREILEDLNQAMTDFDHFLSLEPKMLWGMTKGAWGERQFIAIAGRASPAEFRERIDSIMVKLQAAQAPVSMEMVHREMTEMLRVARFAAINYERLLVLSEFDEKTRREIIQKAYDSIQDVRNRRAELEKSLLPRSVATQKI